MASLFPDDGILPVDGIKIPVEHVLKHSPATATWSLMANKTVWESAEWDNSEDTMMHVRSKSRLNAKYSINSPNVMFSSSPGK